MVGNFTNGRQLNPEPINPHRIQSAFVNVISSMATQRLLKDLFRSYEQETGYPIHLQSMGGVTATETLRQGTAADIAILSSTAIDQLIVEGALVNNGRTDLFRSQTVMAVQAGQPHPPITTEEELRAAVLAANSIGYSSGPSGRAIAALFETWGITAEIADRIVIPPPGKPVGQLITEGTVELGFQQLPELQHLDGIEIVGPLPGSVSIESTFAAGIGPRCDDQEQVTELLEFLGSPQQFEIIRRHGMEPASPLAL